MVESKRSMLVLDGCRCSDFRCEGTAATASISRSNRTLVDMTFGSRDCLGTTLGVPRT